MLVKSSNGRITIKTCTFFSGSFLFRTIFLVYCQWKTFLISIMEFWKKITKRCDFASETAWHTAAHLVSCLTGNIKHSKQNIIKIIIILILLNGIMFFSHHIWWSYHMRLMMDHKEAFWGLYVSLKPWDFFFYRQTCHRNVSKTKQLSEQCCNLLLAKFEC